MAFPTHLSSSDPPGDGLKLRWTERGLARVAVVANDGGHLQIGSPDRWDLILDRPAALRLAVWILATWWFRATWCGLRSRLYFAALRVRLARVAPGR